MATLKELYETGEREMPDEIKSLVDLVFKPAPIWSKFPRMKFDNIDDLVARGKERVSSLPPIPPDCVTDPEFYHSLEEEWYEGDSDG